MISSWELGQKWPSKKVGLVQILVKSNDQANIFFNFDPITFGQSRAAGTSLSATIAAPPNVKVEDYLYYLDLKEQMFGMK